MQTGKKWYKKTGGEKMKKSWLFFLVILLVSCGDDKTAIVKQIQVGLQHNNELKIRLDITTTEAADVYAEYWPDSNKTDTHRVAAISKDELSYTAVLCNIIPQTNYSYRIITGSAGNEKHTKTYTFRSNSLPVWLQEQFKYSCTHPELLPANFKDGFMLLNKREMPGIAYIVDYTGRLRWYHVVENTGLKVTSLTADKTILSILGTNDEPTSYGSEILEVNLWGDTVLHLKKGQGDFNTTIHHDVLKNNSNQVITITEEKKVMDLSSVGGSKNDTVSSDGILVLDSTGRKIWKWTVFDVEDPLKDPAILKNKSDWTHANSLHFDTDSNYIISFYNTGQIWKVDARSGKLIWKLGKGGTIKLPEGYEFSQSHTVHINPKGSLMFFDNGVEKQQSQVFAMKLDEQSKTAGPDLHIKLPVDIYNARMGSAYMITDSTFLCCCSKRHITVLVNRKGEVLWTLDTAIPPYRVDFLTKEQLNPWLQL